MNVWYIRWGFLSATLSYFFFLLLYYWKWVSGKLYFSPIFIRLTCLYVFSFRASSAEEIPAFDNSVQLITICEAAHWMDLPKVFNEARRVLSPNGVFAIIGYHYPVYVPRVEDTAKSDAINKIVDAVCIQGKCKSRVTNYLIPA